MDYQQIADDMKERKAKVDSPSFAAMLTTEFQLMMGLLLALFMLVRTFSTIAAVVIAIPAALVSLRLFYSKTAFRENDDRLSTLLFYALATLVTLILLVGWKP